MFPQYTLAIRPAVFPGLLAHEIIFDVASLPCLADSMVMGLRRQSYVKKACWCEASESKLNKDPCESYATEYPAMISACYASAEYYFCVSGDSRTSFT